MGSVVALLSVTLFIAFVVGLFKPSLVRMPNRKRSSAIYLGGSLILSIIGSSLWPVEHSKSEEKTNSSTAVVKPVQKIFKYADKTIAEYRLEPRKVRHDIVNNYIDFKGVPEAVANSFYSCASEYSFMNPSKEKLGDGLEWCFVEFNRGVEHLDDKINFDVFQDNFSAWDGSYGPLETLIKNDMNDDSSYRHVSTVFHLVWDKDPYAIVETTFHGTNAYGGVVKQTVAAKVDVHTGKVVAILDN
ncbi:hypothetical protein NLN82_27655 [Citrobacter portucalensis]|uniref:hypothetical protein n=1 Tax=Citrobacter portucalensis TaxID=1639133 RepID=UPI00226B5293|nr:hypothetical protein [Citrobacter portucalensis]MCX9039768.1 hypothetical protein [Citrobacter portucalensis]